jgi:hypothetical protein
VARRWKKIVLLCNTIGEQNTNFKIAVGGSCNFGIFASRLTLRTPRLFFAIFAVKSFNPSATPKKTRSRPAIGTAFARGCLTALSFTASHGEVCACGPCFQWKPSPPVRAALARLTDRRSYDRPSADQRPQLTAQAGGSVPQWRRTFRGGRNAQVLRAPKRTLKPSGCSPSRTAGPASHAAISGRALKTSHACIAEYSACIRPAPQQKFRAPLCRSCGG